MRQALTLTIILFLLFWYNTKYVCVGNQTSGIIIRKLHIFNQETINTIARNSYFQTSGNNEKIIFSNIEGNYY